MPRPDEWDWDGLRARCRREALRLLSNADDAEDAVQEAMARGWRRRHRCRSPEAPLPWLLQITRNEAFRLLAQRRMLVVAEPNPSEHWATGGAESEIDLLPLKVDVRRAVARLPDRDQTLATLRYGEDLAQSRIAALLDTPEGTIKVRLHRLRQKLRCDLGETLEGNHEPQ